MINTLRKLSKFLPKPIINFIHKRNYERNNIIIASGAQVSRRTILEGYNKINENCKLNDCYVGMGTYIASNTKFTKIKIGRMCSIGRNIVNYGSLHPTSNFVSTHPAFFSTKKQAGFSLTKEQLFEEYRFINEEKKYYIEIGNDVWIGNEVAIMNGVKIGDGAIIGSRALVTKDVEPYSIVGGVPAKIIRKRFTEEQISFLLEFKWWDKGMDWIIQNSKDFSEIELFIKKNRIDEA